MLQKLLLGFSTLALVIASAGNTYKLTLYQPALIGSTELKAGDYKVEVNGDKAVVKHGKNVAEAAVKTETAERKFEQTSVICTQIDGKTHIQSIQFGGTRTKLVFSD
jgi:hypothetical protein